MGCTHCLPSRSSKDRILWGPNFGRILWHSGTPCGLQTSRMGSTATRRLDAGRRGRRAWRRHEHSRQERRVGAARASPNLAIANSMGHFRLRISCQGALRPKKRNAFIGLDIQDKAVGLKSLFAKDNVGARRNWIIISVLRLARRCRANIKGDACPAPVVDQKVARDKGFGFGSGFTLSSSSIAGTGLSPSFQERLSANDAWATISKSKGRIDWRTFSFSLRTAVASKEAGVRGYSEVSCRTWLRIMSRSAPAVS